DTGEKADGRYCRPPASGSGCCLLGFPAGFGVSSLLVHYPAVSLVKQLGHREQVVEAEAFGFLPDVIALLVTAGGNDAVPVALFAGVPPDGDLQDAAANFECWFRHDDLLLFELGSANQGLTAIEPKRP